MLQSYEDKIFIREHEYYWTPNEYFCGSMLERLKLNGGNSTFMRELCRFFYHRMVMEKNYIAERYILMEDPTIEAEEVAEKALFYEELWDIKFIPGNTPTEQALYYLMERNKDEVKGMFRPNTKKLLKFKKDIPDKEKWEDQNIKELMSSRKITDHNNKKLNLLRKICMVDKFGKTFEIKKSVTEKRVSNSHIHKLKRIVEYGELPNILLYQKLLPNYSTKLLTKDLTINTPIKKEESKQKIIMLIDYSG